MKKVKPGHAAFEYNSINTFVLELIVNQVTGKTLNEVFGERVWRKMGAQNDAFVGVTKYGLVITSYSIHYTKLYDYRLIIIQ